MPNKTNLIGTPINLNRLIKINNSLHHIELQEIG